MRERNLRTFLRDEPDCLRGITVSDDDDGEALMHTRDSYENKRWKILVTPLYR